MSLFLGALLIFGLRLIDVSIGAVRIVMVVRGERWIAGLLGFFESLTWAIAAGLVFSNLNSPVRLVAFAAGFGAGTILGSTIERKVALGKSVMRVITPFETPEVAPALRDAGYGVTVVNAEGKKGDVRLAFTVIPRRRATEVLSIVRSINPDAFVTIEDISTPKVHARRASRIRK
ncbi:MAG: DUF2179 domain-containing protein [Gammaproteobacteria bacterium]|nr:DUF2179 domain-containing protein [Gammaproteobacteria bacterium]